MSKDNLLCFHAGRLSHCTVSNALPLILLMNAYHNISILPCHLLLYMHLQSEARQRQGIQPYGAPDDYAISASNCVSCCHSIIKSTPSVLSDSQQHFVPCGFPRQTWLSSIYCMKAGADIPHWCTNISYSAYMPGSAWWMIRRLYKALRPVRLRRTDTTGRNRSDDSARGATPHHQHIAQHMQLHAMRC